MPAFSATSPGKSILFGEHAVVYGQSAIAVPVTQVRAKATVSPLIGSPAGDIWVKSEVTNLDCALSDLPAKHPFAELFAAVLDELQIQRFPALRLYIRSDIPIASGLGSGAAVSAASARALAAFVGRPLSDEQVSRVAYRVDQIYHGAPSGIDNTVIAYAQPIFYVRGEPFTRLEVGQPFTLVIGNTGDASPTAAVVGDLRARWQANPQPYEQIFAAVGAIAREARKNIEKGVIEALGSLMTRNHALLQELDVSSDALDRLVKAAVEAGAFGAKLCGGGRGGNMIALVDPISAERAAQALRAAGAVSTITTTVQPTQQDAHDDH